LFENPSKWIHPGGLKIVNLSVPAYRKAGGLKIQKCTLQTRPRRASFI